MTTLNTSLLKAFGAALLAGTAMSNIQPGDFVSHLKSSSNIWLMSAQDGDHAAEIKILGWTVFYLVLHNACKVITSTSFCKKKSRRFSKRPSIVTSTIHAVAMWSFAFFSIISIALDFTWVEQVWVMEFIPHSLGYYIADVFWYALPNVDVVVILHHLLMIICHYPLSSDKARALASAGDENWAIWLSMIGYACAELAVPVLNARWWFIAGEHLNKKETKHCGFSGRVSVGLHVAASIIFFERVVAFSLLLILQVMPRYEAYAEADQLLTFGTIVVGHVGTLLISALWLWNILKIGYQSISGVMMQIEEEQKPFSYIADVWQGYGLLDHLASEEAGFLMKIDKGKHPKESTVEARLIMEKAMTKAQRSWLWPLYCMSCFGFSSVGIALYAAHSTLECVDETSLGFLLPWRVEAIHFVIQGFLTYQADVAMEFYSCKKTSRWYKADRLSATLLMTYNVSKIFWFLSESGPRQFSVLALAGAVYCYQREHYELKNKSEVVGLYGAMYWHTLWHLLGCGSCYIWLGLTCAS